MHFFQIVVVDLVAMGKGDLEEERSQEGKRGSKGNERGHVGGPKAAPMGSKGLRGAHGDRMWPEWKAHMALMGG